MKITIGLKIVVLASLLVAVTVYILGDDVARLGGVMLVDHELVDLADETHLEGRRILSLIQTMREDALNIAGADAIEAIYQARNNRGLSDAQRAVEETKHRARLEQICFEAFGVKDESNGETAPEPKPYLQIRVIGGADGIELVRLQWRGDQVISVDEEELKCVVDENEDFRPDNRFFQTTMNRSRDHKALGRQQLYSSDVEVEKGGELTIDEHGHMVGRTVLRVAVPVFPSTGDEPLAVVMINLDVERVAEQMTRSPRHLAFLTNEQGDFLVHPNSEMQWAHRLAAGDDQGDQPQYKIQSLYGEFAGVLRGLQENAPRPDLPLSGPFETFRPVPVDLPRDNSLSLENLTFDFVKIDVIGEPLLTDDVRAALENVRTKLTSGGRPHDALMRWSLGASRTTPRITASAKDPETLRELISLLNEEFPGKLKVAEIIPCRTFSFRAYKLPFDPNDPSRFLLLARAASYEEIKADADAIEAHFFGLLTYFIPGAVLLSFLFSYLLTRPLKKIAAVTRDIAATGDVARVELPIHARDEIGDLARSFDHMIGQIQHREEAIKENEREIREFADVLEQRVKERTAELQSTNEMLAVARDAALEASLAKDTFLSNMSHELRNPLNAIIGFSEMLREDAEDEGRQALVADLRKIHSAGTHLLGLINDVLDIAKISAGTITFQHERFDVHAMLQGLVDMVGPLVDKRSNRLAIEWDDDLGKMHADEGRVRQVLVNLLSNASKFTEGGVITLRAERQSRDGVDWLVFRVLDTGIGMSDEQLGRLFQRFSQVSASKRLKQDGAGLGLALSRELCRLLGGDLTAESQLGSGSTFAAELPAQRPEKPAEPRAPAAAPALQQPAPLVDGSVRAVSDGAILVIDDEATVRDLMTRFLSKEGFQVVTAASGEEGLRMAKQINPAAITLDTVMPGIDGWGVLAALKADASTAHIPVVMVTMVDDQGQGYALGAADYLTKPVDWERLSAVLRQLQCDPTAAPVLVVDDDADTRELISRMLHSAGWKSVTAENGRVALERIETQRPLLILLDLSMPEMDGYEFLRELRRRDPTGSIPVVIVTAADLSDEDRQRLSGSVQQIVGKGESFQSELAQAIRQQVRQHTTRV
ncbi:MAG: response regulator [Planctomycetes bacterium]|nr:response regulator [Planctomycetota bacterium]